MFHFNDFAIAPQALQPCGEVEFYLDGDMVSLSMWINGRNTVDASEIQKNSPVEGKVVYPIIYDGFFTSQVVIAGFLKHQQWRKGQATEGVIVHLPSPVATLMEFCRIGCWHHAGTNIHGSEWVGSFKRKMLLYRN